ncbi:MAG: hypothetical protein P8123_11055 [bacterium]
MKEAVIFQREEEFRKWIRLNLSKIGIKRIILSQDVCPDLVVEMQDGKIAKIEVELFDVNFKYHKHDPVKVDYILACFAREKYIHGVPVIAINKLWIYENQSLEPLPPEGPLSKDEIHLLTTINFYGFIEITSLCTGVYSGNRQLFMRFSPDFVASIPRGRVEDNICNIVSPKAKRYVKKYHHALVAANLSGRACKAIELLSRRGLIKMRPIALLSAVMDGTFIEHEGWIPTELYCTKDVDKYHLDVIRKQLFNSFGR